MSNIIKELSRTSSSRSLRTHDSFASTSAYNLASSSYEINKFTNSLPPSSTASSYSHHIKFNNLKLDEEMSQIENQLKNLSNTSNFIGSSNFQEIVIPNFLLGLKNGRLFLVY